MAHNTLVPEDDVYLSVEEIIFRLKEHFPFVELDRELGQREHDERMAYRRKMLSKQYGTLTLDIKQELEIEETKRDHAVFVQISDSRDPGDEYLCTTLVTGEPVFFGYCSQSHQDASRSLLERIKVVLQYSENE